MIKWLENTPCKDGLLFLQNSDDFDFSKGNDKERAGIRSKGIDRIRRTHSHTGRWQTQIEQFFRTVKQNNNNSQ